MQLKQILCSISETCNFSQHPNVIFLNTGDIFDGKILHNNYSESKFLPGQAKKTIKNQDILFSEIRPANKRFALVCVEDPQNYVVSTKLMVLRCYNSNYSVDYVYSFLTQPRLLSKLQTLAESRSGTFPQITFSEIANLEIPEFSLAEQRHIVDILGSIDAKIENNEQEIRKINDLALCFIAKSNNLNTELKPYIKFIKGRKPIENGRTTAPYLSIDAITSFRYESVYSDDMIMATPFDILMVMDGASSGTVFSHQAGVVSSTIAKIDCSDNIKDYLYWYLLSLKEIIKSRNTGSAIPHANKEYISSLKFDYGFATDIKTINILHSLRTKIIQRQEENKKLQKLKGLYLKKFFE